MQQRGDRLILVRPVFERDRRNGEQVPAIGHARTLADLGAVEAAGLSQRLVEAIGKDGSVGSAAHDLSFRSPSNTACGKRRLRPAARLRASGV